MTCRRSSRRRTVAIVIVAAGIAACDFEYEPSAEGNDPRLLDRACRAHLCELSGSAELTEGLTSDSIGVRLGPGEGQASIRLVHNPSSTRGPELAILAAGTGQFYAGGQVRKLSSTYEWIDVDGIPTGEDTVLLDLSVSEGNTLEVVDVLSDTYDWTKGGCSISRGLGRRR